MNYIITTLRCLGGMSGDKRAVTALEYAMIASLIAVACVTVLTGLGTSINSIFTTINTTLAAHTGS
jgi:pilus assembly protein Flp/PilA